MDVTLTLKNLTTLDVSKNGLMTLDGIQPMKRLKRLISKNNNIRDFSSHLVDTNALIEIDLEANQVDSF
jgi:Leucine-rich repeat (LRR) protein